MIVSGGALTLAAAAIGLLVCSGLWAHWRYRHLSQLPAHFNASGKATRLAPRNVVIWTPVIFAGLLFTGLLLGLPPEKVRGDPGHAVILASLVLLGTQAFVLWLIGRWARGQT